MSRYQMNKQTNWQCDRPPHTLTTAPLLPVPWMCGHHVDGALPGQTRWPYRTSAHFPQSLIDFLLRSCQADQKIAFSSRGIRVFKMFSVIAPWQSFLPWSGLYIMDCHEIIIACLWTNQLVEAEGNYFPCVLLSAHRTFASDNGPGGKKGWGEGRNWTERKGNVVWFFLFVVMVLTNHFSHRPSPFFFSACY